MSKQVSFYINKSKFSNGDKSPTHQASYKDSNDKWINFLSAWTNEYGLSVSLDLGKLKEYMDANPDKVSDYEYKPSVERTPEVAKEVANVELDDLPF